jgi:hypothetical protein
MVELSKLYFISWDYPFIDEKLGMVDKRSVENMLFLCPKNPLQSANYVMRFWNDCNSVTRLSTLGFSLKKSTLGPWFTDWIRFAYGFVFTKKIEKIIWKVRIPRCQWDRGIISRVVNETTRLDPVVLWDHWIWIRSHGVNETVGSNLDIFVKDSIVSTRRRKWISCVIETAGSDPQCRWDCGILYDTAGSFTKTIIGYHSL